jgi:ribosome assembly protein RRB1
MSERGKRAHTKEAASAADAPVPAAPATQLLDEFGQPLEFEQSSDEFDTDSEESVHAGDEIGDDDEDAPIEDSMETGAAGAAPAEEKVCRMHERRLKTAPPHSTRTIQVFRPDRDQVADDEELEYDSKTYDMHHTFTTDWPCLSFDILPDPLGAARTKVWPVWFPTFRQPEN